MEDSSLDEFIKKARDKGKSDDEIRQKLQDEGWKKEDIDGHLKNDEELTAPKPPYQQKNIPKPPSQSHMWDTFENVLLFISLYVLATSIGIALHSFIDEWVPKLDLYGYGYSSGHFALKSAVAAMIIATPIYSFLFLRISRRTIEHPYLRNVRSRKFLMYLTLVITFLIMLINVIQILYGFLNGEVVLNSVLHFAVTVGIALIIFMYYLFQTREDRKVYAQ